MSEILGIDIGGTGVKAAVVDISTGHLLSERLKYATPKPSYPEAVMEVVNKLIDDHNWKGKPIGCGFPGIIKKNVIYSAANVDKSWLGVNLLDLFLKETDQEASFINDADAAGIAEIIYGRGKGVNGTVLLLTLGTGIGSALFRDQVLIPNTEFGHLEHKDTVWEKFASNSARERKDLSWSEWGQELSDYLNHMNLLLSPDMIILGGGVSKKFHKYEQHLKIDIPIVAAAMLNKAGVVGAALHAAQSIYA